RARIEQQGGRTRARSPGKDRQAPHDAHPREAAGAQPDRGGPSPARSVRRRENRPAVIQRSESEESANAAHVFACGGAFDHLAPLRIGELENAVPDDFPETVRVKNRNAGAIDLDPLTMRSEPQWIEAFP